MPSFESGEKVRCGGRYSAEVGGMNSSAPGALTSREADARRRHDAPGLKMALKLGLNIAGPTM